MKLLLIIVFCSLLISGSAQKLVYSEPYSIKNNPFDSRLPRAKILEDSVSKKKLLIIGGMKELSFYLFDADWNLVKKFNKPTNNKSVLNNNFFKIAQFAVNQDKWMFIGGSSDYTRETVDFASQTHLVQPVDLPDIKGIQQNFTDGDRGGALFYTKYKDIRIASFTPDLKLKPILLGVSTELPKRKSGKYSNEEIYNSLEIMNANRVDDPYFTRKKSQFYALNDAYALLLCGDEPVAEVATYDKQTGKKLKNRLFSVEDLLGKDTKGKEFNTAALLHDNKVYLLSGYKSGGVFGIFDAESGNKIYSFSYSEKDPNTIFSYGPVTYETLPGTLNLSVLKEKLDDISMEKFCKEIYKHSCAVTVKNYHKGGLLITLANYDEKNLASGTSHLSSSMNTIYSSNWFISTSAGLLLDPASMSLSKKKITFKDANQSKASPRYEKINPVVAKAEYNDKKAFIFETQTIGNRSYVVYYFNGQLKVHETTIL